MSGTLSVEERLTATYSQIEQICQISGNAGLSIGVLHHGKVIHRANFGYRDVEKQISPDSDTVFHLGSLTKFVTSAAAGVLVEHGHFSWDTKVRDIWSDFHQKNKEVEEEANVIDMLAHRMALQMRFPYWVQMENQLLLPAEENVNVLGDLDSVGEFRKDLKYNNWTYGVIGNIIEMLSGESLESFVEKYITEPLGLQRTTMGEPPKDNYAKSYMCWDDGTPYEVPAPSLTSGGVVAGAGALKSSVNDMLILYDAYLKALADQENTKKTSTPGNPFVQAEAIWTEHIKKNLTGYGLGWFLVDLPGPTGWIGLNEARVEQMPTIARETGPTKIGYHNGNMPGALSSVHVIPESHTAIVVFANSIPFSDVPDWVGGLLLEAILDTPNPNDFVALAKEARRSAVEKPKETAKKMDEERVPDTKAKPLDDYAGNYFNHIGNIYLEVTVQGDGLRMRVQGYPETCYDLHHYHHDTFAWDVNREWEMQHAMFPSWFDGLHKLHFASNGSEGIDRVMWRYARDVPDPGETFMKSIVGQGIISQAQHPLFGGPPRI